MVALDEQHLHQRAAVLLEIVGFALHGHARPAPACVHDAAVWPLTRTVHTLQLPCGLNSGW